jgi:hypothetical protein
MSAILLILGIVVTGVGSAALGFGIPINELSIGTSLILAGTIALCGGLILIGLSAAVAELRRIGDLLKLRPVVQPARRAEAAPPPVAAPAPSASIPPAPPVQPPPYTGPPPPAPVTLGPAILGPTTHGPGTHGPGTLGPSTLGPSISSPQPPGPSVSPPVPASVRPPSATPARPRTESPSRDLRHTEPQSSPSASMDVSTAAIERLRSSIRPDRSTGVPEGEEFPLSPNGNHQPARRVSAEPALEPRLSPEDRLSGTADAAKASRLDFLFKSRQQAVPRADSADPSRPAEARPARGAPPEAEVQPRYSDAMRAGAPAVSSSPAPAPVTPAPVSAPVETIQEPAASTAMEPPSTVLKSGVVDGMAYTLYTDGSIEAKLPDGTVKFGSIGELRAHIEKNP